MIFLSVGMFLIASWSRKKTVFVSGVLVALWPHAMLSSSMTIAVVHVSCVKWTLANFHSWQWSQLFQMGYRVRIMFDQ